MDTLQKSTTGSDDDDDIETLRLAALKSLKLKPTNAVPNKPTENPRVLFKPQTFGAAHTTRHNNRGFRGRNGINSRVRSNPNLIPIQTIDQNEPEEKPDVSSTEVSNLILPQDRYHKRKTQETIIKDSISNKFDRYDNSDESESDSDELLKPAKRERKGSLEQLMDDLENEINVLEAKTSAPEKVEESDAKPKEVVDKNEEVKNEEVSDTLVIAENKPDPDPGQIDGESSVQNKECSSSRRNSAEPKPISVNKTQRTRSRSKSRSPYKSPYRSPARKQRYLSPYHLRPLSPLLINTEVLNTITKAPLSPRSAAFVLQNREIVARRQMSPRRSLSRGSSRSRSITPKRRRTRSSSLSPRRRSISPRMNRRSPNYKLQRKRNSHSPKQSVHKRLGSRNSSPHFDPKKRSNRSISLSLSPSPDRNYHKRPLNETTGHVNEPRRPREKVRKNSPQLIPKPVEKPLDPILEARKRKFESQPNFEPNGVIKLKPKTDDLNVQKEVETQPVEPTENKTEDVDDTVLDLNPAIDELWSDEESDNENEGRFKCNPNSQKKNIAVLPFRKLVEKPAPKTFSVTDKKYNKPKNYVRRRSRSPLNKLNTKLEPGNDSKTKTINENSHSKLIELDKEKDTGNDNLDVKSDRNVIRKVKIQKLDESNSSLEDEPKLIAAIEEIVTTKDDDGDLRAELSRRRAQRLIKAGSLAESLPARLLKTALQEAVPKRPLCKLSKVSKGCESSANRRVLIVKRLISSHATQLESDNTVSKKDGKLPIHMRLGLTSTSENVIHSERRQKRSRSSRRKKGTVQV